MADKLLYMVCGHMSAKTSLNTFLSSVRWGKSQEYVSLGPKWKPLAIYKVRDRWSQCDVTKVLSQLVLEAILEQIQTWDFKASV